MFQVSIWMGGCGGILFLSHTRERVQLSAHPMTPRDGHRAMPGTRASKSATGRGAERFTVRFPRRQGFRSEVEVVEVPCHIDSDRVRAFEDHGVVSELFGHISRGGARHLRRNCQTSDGCPKHGGTNRRIVWTPGHPQHLGRNQKKWMESRWIPLLLKHSPFGKLRARRLQSSFSLSLSLSLSVSLSTQMNMKRVLVLWRSTLVPSLFSGSTCAQTTPPRSRTWRRAHRR